MKNGDIVYLRSDIETLESWSQLESFRRDLTKDTAYPITCIDSYTYSVNGHNTKTEVLGTSLTTCFKPKEWFITEAEYLAQKGKSKEPEFEIQQYLPEGHPDLIVKDGKIPENYIVLLSSFGSPFTVGSLQKAEIIKNNNAFVTGYCFPKETYRKATPEEIASVTKPKDETAFESVLNQGIVIEDSKEPTEQELIQEAIRRGFVEGSEFQFSEWDNINRKLKGVVKGPIYQDIYNGSKRIVSEFGDGLIWSDRYGWATIVTPAPKIEEWFIPDFKIDMKMRIGIPLDESDKAKIAVWDDLVDLHSQQDEQPILISKVKTSNKIIVL